MLCEVIRWNIGVSIVVYMTVYFFVRENILKSQNCCFHFYQKIIARPLLNQLGQQVPVRNNRVTSHSTDFSFLNEFLTHFMPLVSFYTPLKTSENHHQVFWYFQGVQKETTKWVNRS